MAADLMRNSHESSFSFQGSKDRFKFIILRAKDGFDLAEIEDASKACCGSENEKKLSADQAFRECMKEQLTNKGSIDCYRLLVNLAVLAAQKGLASTTLPFYLLSDVFETVTLDLCEAFFSYVEERITTWTSDLFFNAGKNHLLRMSNDLVHRLSTSQNTVFCGRIQLFLARLFPLSEKSGLNLMSQFNVENITVYTLTDDPTKEKDGLVDDGMETEEGEEAGELAQSVPIDYNLYKKFWVLQDFFSNPTKCYDLAKWKKFVESTKEVLNVFNSYKLEHIAQKRKAQEFRELTSSETMDHKYFAKFLTSEKLLDLQLNDSNFRRTVLVQFLLIFQYLTGNVKFKSNTQVLKELQTTWVKEATTKIYELLKETPPDGEKFASILEHMLSREENWTSWKNDGCPSFIKERPKEAAKPARVRKRSIGEVLSASPKKIDLGSTELTRLWNLCPDNMEACKSEDRLFLPTLKDFFVDAIEQIDPEAGIEEEYKVINKSDFGWRALRLLARRSQHFFQPSNTPFKTLPAYLESEVQQLSKDLQAPPKDDDSIVENGSAMSSEIS